VTGDEDTESYSGSGWEYTPEVSYDGDGYLIQKDIGLHEKSLVGDLNIIDEIDSVFK